MANHKIKLQKKTGTHTRYGSEEIYDFKTEYIEMLEELVKEIKDSNPKKEQIRLYLSADDD